ncbi:MAG TPA: alkaline phosphatase D family protein [Verrucomicrobiae bacterium]
MNSHGKPSLISRRHFTRNLLLSGGSLGLLPNILRAQQAPGVLQANRPIIQGGAMTGDIVGSNGIFWSRCDRPATMLLELSTTSKFTDSRRIRGPIALEDTDYAVKLAYGALPPGQTIFYRLAFEDLANSNVLSESITGSFKTPSADKRDILFAWSGDTAGQGYGIDVSRGGMRTYEAIRKLQPDFFIHGGDTIYADNPLQAEMKLDDGTVWKNIITPEKSKVAETLSEFRGNHFYNLLDENVRRMNSEVPIYFQWDDHEVLNNWYPGKQMTEDKRYTVKSASLLAARARRAFFDCLPIRPHPLERIYRNIPYGPSLELFFLDMRSYRGANSPNRQNELDDASAFLGRQQLDELKRALSASKATWKIICSDMPISLQCRDGKDSFEAVANGDGPALGRELEIADLLRFLKERKIRNTVWITTDVHHCSSIYHDPSKATFQEFDPFWEFISGPLHAGTFGPPASDNTFGAETRFIGIPKGMKGNRPPSDVYQFFGTMKIDAKTEELTVTHWDVNGKNLWNITIPPKLG